jgi:hypothetical protein
VALRQAHLDEQADQLELKIAEAAPSHLLLQLLRQRRAMQRQDLPGLTKLLVTEAEQAQNGVLGVGGQLVRDAAWACESLVAAADCALQAGDLTQAESLLLRAESLLSKPLSGPSLAHRRLIDALLEEIYLRSSREGLLAALFERRIADGNLSEVEDTLLRETLLALYCGILSVPESARHISASC